MSCRKSECKRRLVFFAFLVLFYSGFLLSSRFLAYAGEQPAVSLSVSEKNVHSGGGIAFTATLSAPAQGDISVAVTGGSKDFSISIPRGETSGTLTVRAGQYKERSSETYSVAAGSDYAAGEKSSVKVSVLPKPRLSFYAEKYTANPGAKLSVNLWCLNASEMTIPLKVTLRQSDGRTVESFEFSDKKKSYNYKYTFPEDWEAPFYLYMYNETTGKKAAQIPVKVMDTNRMKGIYSVETQEKKIAISFDCGFANKYTQYILDTLDEYNIKCTFFVTGVFVSDHSDMLKEIHKRGHEIGNHTARHRSLPKLSEEDVYKEVKSVNDTIYKKLGVTPTVMRPPYGSGNFNVHSTVRMAGCEVVYWSHDSLDWDPDRTADEIIRRSTTDIKNGSIVLFHNSAPKTKQTLRKILDKYKKMGYKIVPVSELIYRNYFTIDKMGVQRLKSGYKQVSPSDLMSDYTPVINVSGASAEGEPAVSLELNAVYSSKSQVMSKKTISKIKKDYSLMKVTYDCGDTIAAPVKKGDRIGTATFSYGSDVKFTAELTAASDIEPYQPPVEKPAVISPSDTEEKKRWGMDIPHSLEYILDGAAVLLLAVISMIIFLIKRKRK